MKKRIFRFKYYGRSLFGTDAEENIVGRAYELNYKKLRSSRLSTRKEDTPKSTK